MWLRPFLGILGFITLATTGSLPSRSSYTIKEDHCAPRKWEVVGPANDDHWIRLNIALKSDKSAELEQHLYEVSDPAHYRYGRHLSSVEVNALVAPADESTALVERWLLDHEILDFQYNSARDWIRTSPVNVRKVEYLLDTKYYLFRHFEDNTTAVRAPIWSLPSHLHNHIDTVQPTNSFLNLRNPKLSPFEPPEILLGSRSERDEYNLGGGGPTYADLVAVDILELGHIPVPDIEDMSSHPTVAEACNNAAISALCIQVLYGTFGYVPQVPEKSKIGMTNYLGEFINQTDINLYLEKYRADAAAAGAAYKIKIQGINKSPDGDFPIESHMNAGLEGALDAETLIGLGFPIPIVAYNVGGRPPFIPTKGYDTNINEPYLDWIQYMLSLPQADLPQVVTTSYSEPEQTVPQAYAQRVCQGFAQLGARGVSIIFASGDQGVGRDGDCFSNGKGVSVPKFQPGFPASCPFVTSVGGTRELSPEVAGFNARTGYVTGGGFSDYFSRPHYQNTAVKDYLERRLEAGKFKGLYNPEGRGIPDVAAMSYQYAIIHQGQSHLSDGTSAAAPTFAAVIALINDALMAEGRPPLGFLNPWIYSDGWEGFTDILFGSNKGCNTTGFPASEGWDPVSGFGTPIFPKLKDLALKYQYRATKPWYIS